MHGARGGRTGKGRAQVQGAAHTIPSSLQGQEWSQDLGVREAIKVNHGCGSKKLEEMFDPMHQGIAGRTLAAMARIGKSVAPSIAHGKLVRVESLETRE